MTSQLPPGFEFLECEGRVIFPSSGASGGLGDKLIAVVMQKRPHIGYVGDFGRESMGVQDRDGGRWHVVEASYFDGPSVFTAKIKKAIDALLA